MDDKVSIIDRTLIEISSVNPKVSFKKLIKLSEGLSIIGADLLEIDKNFAAFLNIDNSSQSKDIFIVRIDSLKEVDDESLDGFRHFIISSKQNIENVDLTRQASITVEYESETLQELIRDKKLYSLVEALTPYCIRIKGLNKYEPQNWNEAIRTLKLKFDTNIDICPQNKFYCATAVAIESAISGTDFITTSFCGIGGNKGYAPLEEVSMALSQLYGRNRNLDMFILPQLVQQLEDLMKVPIHCQKPILGEDIFKCESGIHVDGLMKNPATYEPYSPELVGKERELILGKHSGSALIKKLMEEQGVNYKELDLDSIMSKVREEGIKSKKISDWKSFIRRISTQ